MNANNNNISLPAPSLVQITNTVSQFLHRFHVLVFSLVVLGGLAVATFMLYQTATASPDGNAAAASSNSFDSQTIEKVKALRSSDEESQPLQLNGRVNPFQ